MNAPLHDRRPLAGVVDEIKRTLNETGQAVARFVRDNESSGQADLSALDAAALHMVRQQLQQLQQTAGALDMVELAAATTTLRALEAAIERLIQKPALATAATRQTIQSGAHALIEYLDRMLRGRPVSELALFPTYRDWQQLAGISRAHPADLWVQAHADPVLPPGKVYEPGAAVRAHLERLVLHVVKALSPQAALPLAQLTGGLARAAQDAAVRRFWVAAAAYFEAVGSGHLPDAVYVKRAASSVLLQYTRLLHGDTQNLAGHTHDLLYLASRVAPGAEAPAQAHLRAVWAAHGWTAQTPWDPERRQLGRYDPAALDALRASVHTAQQSWSALSESKDVAPSSVAAALDPLVDGLQQLLPGFAPMVDLATSWSAVAAVCRRSPCLPEGLALEASNGLLLLGAQLHDFDLLDASTAERLSALNQRLNQRLIRALEGEPVPPSALWSLQGRYQPLHEQGALASLLPEPPVLEDVVALPDDTSGLPVLDAAVNVIGSLLVEQDRYNVFLHQADECSHRLCQGLAEWALDRAQPLPQTLSVWAHELAGGAAAVGYTGLSQLARALEHALDRAVAVTPPPAVTAQQAVLWVQAAQEVRHLLHQFAAGFLRQPKAETLAALDALDALAPAPATPLAAPDRIAEPEPEPVPDPVPEPEQAAAPRKPADRIAAQDFFTTA